MLNGIYPLLVIVLKNKGVIDYFGEGEGTSFLDSVAETVGLPIPIYLSEQLTGVYVDTESKSVDVVTRVDAATDKGTDGQVNTPEVSQQSADTQVSVSLFAKKGSIVLTALLALMDMIVDRLVSAEYDIHYLNGPTAIFGAKLARFSHSSASGSELINIELALSTAAKQKNPTPQAPVPSVARSTNPVAL